MADIQIAPSFGAELKDAFKPVNTWVAHGIAWVEDIQSFYRERSVIEKEYASKLAALGKKYYEKKAKKTGTLSVGDEPKMTPGSLESASLTTWTTQLTTVESRAAEHDQFGNHLVSQVAEPLRAIALRYEDIRKRQTDYAERLEKERDKTYSDLKKIKHKYDEACQEVENKRKKSESAFDYSKTKAQNAYQAQIHEMNNVKNTYLIAIRATNKQKEMYYHEYVPDLLDSLQELNETRTAKLNHYWTVAATLENKMLKKSSDFVTYLLQEIPRNVPQLDTMMFVRHNAASWTEPLDKAFEPSPVWHDDDKMVVDEPAKVYLRNILNKSKSQLGELRRQVDVKRKEVEGGKRVIAAIREGKDNRDEAQVLHQLLNLQENLHKVDHERLNAEVETQSITSTIGDLTIGAKGHNFKSQTFKIPTNCDLCGERIWGLSAKGFDCRDCGYTCHSKCEMKVPAECPGEQSKEERKKLKHERQAKANAGRKVSVSTVHQNGSNGSVGTPVAELGPTLSRSNTMNSLSSGYAQSAHRSIASRGGGGPNNGLTPQITGSSYEAPAEPSRASKPTGPSGTVRRKRIVAPPPTTYKPIELPVEDTNGGGEGGMLSLPSNEQRGKMLYAYDANGAGELTVSEGTEVTVLEPEDGSGWVKVKAGYKEGLVPETYMEILPPASPFSPSSSPSGPPPNANRPVSSYSSNSLNNSSLSLSGGAKPKQGPAVAPRRGAKKVKHVEALYDYQAQSDSEWSMLEGDMFVLVKEDQGDGWADVERGGVVRSVPWSYVQVVQ